MKRKQLLIQKLEPGKKVDHPLFVEKSGCAQMWEMALPYIIAFVGGIIGLMIGMLYYAH